MTAKTWGSNAAVRIPASVMDATHLHLDEDVQVWVEKGGMVIEAERKKTYKLDDLLKGIKPRTGMRALTSRPGGTEVLVMADITCPTRV